MLRFNTFNGSSFRWGSITLPLLQIPNGEQVYTSPGTYSWVCPGGVKSVAVVCVGAGGSGSGYFDTRSLYGGGGGGLGYKNNITVVPGQTYTVVVGAPGTTGSPSDTNSGNGGDSYFINTSTVKGGGGSGTGAGGTYTGDGGGNGGAGGSNRGGGGAGGYAGAGGAGGGSDYVPNASPGTGGGGAGGYAGTTNEKAGSSGGGVGLFGQGSSGAIGASVLQYQHDGGQGGSGGTNGGLGLYRAQGGAGGNYGGGGGVGGWYGTGNYGANGAVRIIWGNTIVFGTRAFPSTNTGNL